MNRPIKFRAWDGLRMTTSGIMFNCSTSILEVPEGSRMILMQFTGLHDKNGKEIYEGDIVKWDDRSNGAYWRFAVVEINPDISFNCKLIKSVNGICNSASINYRFGNFIYTDTHRHLGIIGNIYENPNLLK